MATLEGMMRNLVPEANKELLEFVKPMVMEWLDNQGRNKWLFLWNWMQSQPVFKVLHSATEFLTLPEKLGELKEQEQRRLFHFTIYENWKKLLFVLGIVGWVGVWFGLYAGEELLWQMAAGTAGIGLVGSFWCSYKQKKWLKYMNEKRR
ncbi:MAG: hypothetical protein LRY73_07275 [Bacillus sp. (in: Bacteria)]|nr:hypothetical protein [Bacillus sp. (in: firmicutes)]